VYLEADPSLMVHSAEGHWKYYFDPAISLLITCIIFSSALPLGESRYSVALGDRLQPAKYVRRTCALQSRARVTFCCKVCHRISPLKRSGMLSSLALELFLFTRLVFRLRTCQIRRADINLTCSYTFGNFQKRPWSRPFTSWSAVTSTT
jgi:hypothetical protein